MTPHSKEALTNTTPADLAWFIGVWQGKNGNDIVEEPWSALGGGTIMGMFRWQKGDKVWFYEFMTLEPYGDGVMLRIKHFYPELKGWEEKDLSTEFLLVELHGKEAVFLQVNKPGPWLVYRLEDGQMITYFAKEGEETKEDDWFVYERS